MPRKENDLSEKQEAKGRLREAYRNCRAFVGVGMTEVGLNLYLDGGVILPKYLPDMFE
jgi:hypothetical protein